LNASGNPAETIKRLTPFASTAQENVLTPLAEAYLANNQAAQAWQTVSRCQLTEQTSLEFLDLRQRVAEQSGQAAEAYRSAAERSLRSGEYRQAQAVLEQATRLPGTPAATAARLQVMAQEIARLENATKQHNH
jgi:predicted Zn-dependent protease